MEKLIKKLLREGLKYSHTNNATQDQYMIGEDEEKRIINSARNGGISDFKNRIHLGGPLNKPNNKDPKSIAPNTIYRGEESIVDFGISQIGTVNINGTPIPNSIYLQGGYNAARQRVGYGTDGIRFLFNKFPKIQNIILGCYETACPFWEKIGGKEIHSKEMENGLFRILIVTRDSFDKKVGL